MEPRCIPRTNINWLIGNGKTDIGKKEYHSFTQQVKKIITLLNPAVVAAASFEEAEEIIGNKTPVLATSGQDDHTTYIADPVPDFISTGSTYSHLLLQSNGNAELAIAGIKWYLKPLFYYVVWPLCAAVAGALIAFLIDLTYTELFLNMKY